MTYENLLYDRQDHVAVVTLNRPERLNALSRGLQQDFLAVLAEARADDSVWSVIITGAGRGFCSGADISGPPPAGEQRTVTQNERLDEWSWVGRQAMAIYNFDKPTIAAMNGVCAGAGMSMALGCDLRVGSENARFRSVFLERNLSPDSGMSWFMPCIIGYSRAIDLILTSRDVNADEAYRLGLLDRLVPAEKLMDESLALANQFGQHPPIAVRAAKRVTQQNLNKNLEDGLRNELYHLSFGRSAPNDAKESRDARAERRKPNYTGT
ncbi:MAG: enoyl-CoA hydratase/isomerase family protein [Thermoflexaceae bacterium]|nr:enoyl-CoA hydratase/isomerase family protein [Thermoflexaceae bacterium]